jgi:Peptidase_C39 like family
MAVLLATISVAAAQDDSLPNFNAPTDNSPLNTDKVNRAFGVSVFKDSSLWDEDEAAVAKRLDWPEESRTSTQSSYRLYPTQKKPVTILGARAYSCVLYATQGKPTEISIVFVNEGDYEWTQNMVQVAVETAQRLKPSDDPVAPATTNSDATPDTNAAPTAPDAPTNSPADSAFSRLNGDDISGIDKKVHDDFEKALKQDAQTLTDALTGLFGNPAHEGFGGGSETRERVMRWDWQGHAFLLSTPKDTYVTLRIVPTAFADNYGKGDNIEADDLKALLLQRVKQSESGDVVVTDIPMVDQGPKGYCVPATWERYLRYLGIPADMYVLAMAAGTSQKGTNLDAMVENVDSLVTLYHRKIDVVPGDLDLKTIAKNIDNGFPIMWSCYIHVPFEKAIMKRKEDRSKVTDWSAWSTQLADQDDMEIAKEIKGTPVDGGHQRMIIGYNDKTGEIAISDSWSKAFAIRWMTLKEANAINAGQSYVIGL